jgi:aminoglycoside 3-N-acetyltransferase
LAKVSRILFPTGADSVLIPCELLAKRLSWSSEWMRKQLERFRWCRRPHRQTADRNEFKQYLREIGVTDGTLVMVHTSVSDLQLLEASAPPPRISNFLKSAYDLVNDLLELLGPQGTLVMPTHPYYQAEENWISAAERNRLISYNPQTTPCAVGLANELFRRCQGVSRSLHPYNSLAASGPLADELLRNNLNNDKPLPHGIHSGYYRFSQRNGLVISIGVPLRDCMTLIHSPEEVRDAEWPIKNFFEERRYLVHRDNQDQLFVVRQRRPEYAKYCICVRKTFRDLTREHIVHETTFGTVRIDWAHSRDVFDHFMSRNQHSPYPYYGTRFVS